jgi:hypothetical protein
MKTSAVLPCGGRRYRGALKDLGLTGLQLSFARVLGDVRRSLVEDDPVGDRDHNRPPAGTFTRWGLVESAV